MEIVIAFILGASTVMVADILMDRRHTRRDARIYNKYAAHRDAMIAQARAYQAERNSSYPSWEDDGFCGCHETWSEHEQCMTQGTTATTSTPDTDWTK